MRRQPQRRRATRPPQEDTPHTLETRWVKFQTGLTIMWGAIDLALAFIVFALINYAVPYLLQVVTRSKWVGSHAYYVTTPAAVIVSVMALAYLIYRSYYNVSKKSMGFFSNEFFGRNIQWGFSQGGGLKNPLLTPVESVLWTSRTISDVTEQIAGTIDGKRDNWSIKFSVSWSPNSAQFLLRGENKTERIANSDIDALAQAVQHLRNSVNSGRRPGSTRINLAGSKGIEVLVTVKLVQPSAESLQSYNDEVQADQTAAGIRRLLDLNRGRKKADRISVADAGAMMANTYTRNATVVELKGDPTALEKVKVEINNHGT